MRGDAKECGQGRRNGLVPNVNSDWPVASGTKSRLSSGGLRCGGSGASQAQHQGLVWFTCIYTHPECYDVSELYKLWGFDFLFRKTLRDWLIASMSIQEATAAPASELD